MKKDNLRFLILTSNFLILRLDCFILILKTLILNGIAMQSRGKNDLEQKIMIIYQAFQDSK